MKTQLKNSHVNLTSSSEELRDSIIRYHSLPVLDRSQPFLVLDGDTFRYGTRPVVAPRHGFMIPMPILSADIILQAIFDKDGLLYLTEVRSSLQKARFPQKAEKHEKRAERFLRKFLNLMKQCQVIEVARNDVRDSASILPDLADGARVVELTVRSFEKIYRLRPETALSGKMLVCTPIDGAIITNAYLAREKNTVKIPLPEGLSVGHLLNLLTNSSATACIVGTLRAGEARGMSVDLDHHPILTEAVKAIEAGLLAIVEHGGCTGAST